MGAKDTLTTAATSNGSTYLKFTENGSVRADQILIKGTGITTVSSDANGVLTINTNNPNTHYTTTLFVGEKDTKANKAITSPYIKLFDDNTLRSQYLITGGNDITVTSDANGNITIDNNYTAMGTFLPLAGGQMKGNITWKDSTALPENTTPEYFLTITAFASGGNTKWASKANTLKALTGLTSTAIGSSSTPIYWDGSKFVTSTSIHEATTGFYIGEATTKANKNITNPYLKIFDDNTLRNQYQVKGGSNVSVISDANGNITIASSYSDTHWTGNLHLGAKDTITTAATSNGSTYLKFVENNTLRSNQILIKGTGCVSVSSDANGVLTINGVDTDTHYTTSLYIGEVDTKANKAITSPYIKIFDNNTLRNQYQFKGGTGISVASDANGNVTITNTAPDTDTKVNQSETTTSNWRGIVLGYNDNGNPNTGISSNVTNVVYTSNKLTFQPSTGNISTQGNIIFDSSHGIQQKQADTSNATVAITWLKGGTGWKKSDGTLYTSQPGISQHNTGDTYGAITILPYATDTNLWAGSVGLYIGKTVLKWENNTILHSSNYTSYVDYYIYIGEANTNSNKAITNPYIKLYNLSTKKSQYQVKGNNNITVTSDASGNITIQDTLTYLYVGSSNTASHAAVTSNPYIKLYDGSTRRSEVQIKGSGGTTVSSDASGNITISSETTSHTHQIKINGTTYTIPYTGSVDCGWYIEKLAWWTSGSGQNVNDITSGTTFVYTNHGAPTTGTIAVFSCRNNSYQLQIQSSYSSRGNFYYRSKNGDNGTWLDWTRVIDAANYTSYIDYHLYVGAANANSNAAVSNPYIKLYNLTTNKYQYQVKGGTGITVASDASGNITITNTAPDTDTKVTQNSNSDNVDYPLVWSNQNNTSTVQANQLHKSYADLVYNPYYKTIKTAGGYIMGNASGYFIYRDFLGGSNLEAGFYFHSSGRESVVFANQYAHTGWIFVNGIKPSNRTQWNALGVTPAVQIHHNALYINRAVRDADTADYNLFVNGTGNFENNIWVRGSGVYLRLGPQNSSHAHYETNAGTSHLFNKRVDVNGAIWRYGTNYGIADNGRFYALAMYANRSASSTDGGVSLYSDSDPMTYGIAFRGTGSYGKFQGIQSDWATYLTMNDDTSRGWMFRRGSTNVLAIDGYGSMNRFMTRRLRLPGKYQLPTGWYRLAKIQGLDGYFNFNAFFTGGWNWGAPTAVLVNCYCWDATPRITQISGQNNGVITKMRLYNISGDTYYLDIYNSYTPSGGTVSDQYVIINGSVNIVEAYEPTSTNGDSGGYELTFENINGHVVTRENAWWANIQVQTSASTSTSPTVSTIYASNWFRSTGATGWYSESYDGGIWMTDSSWIRTYGSKHFYVEGGNFAVSGSAGIGTTSPSYKLHVVGSTYITDYVGIGTNPDSSLGRLRFPYNQIAINFREEAYRTSIQYMTSGNEALVFSTQQTYTSFIFKCGYNMSSNTSDWSSSNIGIPSIQIKNQSLYVNTAIANGSTPGYNFYVSGNSRLDGNLHIFPGSNSNWGEGIRIHSASNGWTSLILCGTDNTGDGGTSANSWSLHTYGSNFYLSKNGSTGGTSYMDNISNKWYFNTTSGGECVNIGGWVNTVGACGWYNSTYGGGMWMNDSTWIRNYNNKPLFIYTSTANSDATPITRFVKNWDCGNRAQYDTVVISSNDCTSLRLIEADGTCTGISAGDSKSILATTHNFQFYSGCSNTGTIYSGMGGTFRFGINYSSFDAWVERGLRVNASGSFWTHNPASSNSGVCIFADSNSMNTYIHMKPSSHSNFWGLATYYESGSFGYASNLLVYQAPTSGTNLVNNCYIFRGISYGGQGQSYVATCEGNAYNLVILAVFTLSRLRPSSATYSVYQKYGLIEPVIQSQVRNEWHGAWYTMDGGMIIEMQMRSGYQAYTTKTTINVVSAVGVISETWIGGRQIGVAHDVDVFHGSLGSFDIAVTAVYPTPYTNSSSFEQTNIGPGRYLVITNRSIDGWSSNDSIGRTAWQGLYENREGACITFKVTCFGYMS